MQNINKALKETLETCRIDKGGVWIDTYNKTVSEGIAGTVYAGINQKNHVYVSVWKHENNTIKRRSAD